MNNKIIPLQEASSVNSDEITKANFSKRDDKDHTKGGPFQ
jgi:hypothetical protein